MIEELKQEIHELKRQIFELRRQVNELRSNKKQYINNVTDTEIILTDTLNDEDKYKIYIMSGNIVREKVGE